MEAIMPILAILGAALLIAFAAWGVVLRVKGVRTPPSGNDPDDFTRNNII
jgi:hypothetical protein